MRQRILVASVVVSLALSSPVTAPNQAAVAQWEAAPRPLSREERIQERKARRDFREMPFSIPVKFQRLFYRKCFEDSELDLQLYYAGELGRSPTGAGQRVQGKPARSGAFQWDVSKDVVIFVVSLSLRRYPSSLGVVRLDGRNVYVNVTVCLEDRGIDDKIAKLGDVSVREFLRPLFEDIRPVESPKRADDPR